jgi:sporulation protein YlmC with PRC-barrel domain
MIISCFNNNSKNDKIEELIFEIDDQKLSESIIDDSLQIVFCPPKNWKSLSEKEKEAFIIKMDSLKQIGSDISIHPKHIFVHSSIHCFLMVHSVDFTGDTLDVGEIENEYNAYLLNKFENQLLKKGIFLKDNILMTQYVIKDGARIIFKLFFRIKNNRLVQFDYFVFSNHEEEIRAIESSIGSIKRL